jgi:hypothetical protein
VPSVAFPSTASNVHHARPSCTPARSWPELAQWELRHALHAAALYVVALHRSSSFFRCWSRARFGLAASHLHMSEPRASWTRSHFAGSASLLPRLAFRRIPWLRPRYGYHVPASRVTAFHRYSSCACHCSAHRASAPSARAHGPALLRPPNTCAHRQLLRVTARSLAPPARHRSRSCRFSTCTGFSARELLHRRNHAASAHAGAVRANSAAVVARALCSRAPFPPVPPSSCSTPAQPAPLQCLPPPTPLHIHALPRRHSAAAWPSPARAPGLAASASHSSTRFCSASAPPKPRAPTAASV